MNAPASRAALLAMRAAASALRVARVDAAGGVVEQRARAVDLDHRVHERVLDRLEEADLALELLALLRVLDGGLELPLARAAQVGGDRDEQRGPRARAARRRRRR